MFPVRTPTEQRLSPCSLSRPSEPRRALRLVSVVVLALAAALASCGADSADLAATTQPDEVTSTIPASTTAPVASTMPPTSTTTTTTTTPAPPDLPPLLVTNAGEVRVVADGESTPLVSDVAVTMALPDLQGGIVYATDQQGTARWVWDAATGLSRLEGEPGWVPSALYHLSAVGDPELIVDGSNGYVQLVQVAELDERPTLIYRAWRGGSGECGNGVDQCAWMTITEHLFRRDLLTGETSDLGIVGSFESNLVAVRFSDRGLLVLTSGYGADDGCGALFPIEALASSRPDEWIGEGGALWRRCEFGPSVGCEPDASVGESWCWGPFTADIDGAGTSIAYAMARRAWSGDDAEAPVLVILTVPDLTEQARIVIGEPGTATTWIDHDGTWTVVGRDDLPPVVVGRDGVVHELPAATYVALWHEGR